MKMKWQFATIFAAIYAVSPVGAVEGVKVVTQEELAQLRQLGGAHNTPNPNQPAQNNKPGFIPPPDTSRFDQSRLDRMGAGPLDLLRRSTGGGAAQAAVDAGRNKPNVREPAAQSGTVIRVASTDKPGKAPKLPKRAKSSKRQAKSR